VNSGVGKPLEFHQPDPDLPDRMLGICQACKTWVLINLGSDGKPTMAELPRPSGDFPA
jgi:hypothetical protein